MNFSGEVFITNRSRRQLLLENQSQLHWSTILAFLHKRPLPLPKLEMAPITLAGSADSKNKFEDLSGIDTAEYANPYDALIEACHDDPVFTFPLSTPFIPSDEQHYNCIWV